MRQRIIFESDGPASQVVGEWDLCDRQFENLLRFHDALVISGKRYKLIGTKPMAPGSTGWVFVARELSREALES